MKYVTDAEAANVRPFEAWESKTPNDLFTERLLATRAALLALFDEVHDEYACERMAKENGDEECRYCAIAAQIRGA